MLTMIRRALGCSSEKARSPRVSEEPTVSEDFTPIVRREVRLNMARTVKEE